MNTEEALKAAFRELLYQPIDNLKAPEIWQQILKDVKARISWGSRLEELHQLAISNKLPDGTDVSTIPVSQEEIKEFRSVKENVPTKDLPENYLSKPGTAEEIKIIQSKKASEAHLKVKEDIYNSIKKGLSANNEPIIVTADEAFNLAWEVLQDSNLEAYKKQLKEKEKGNWPSFSKREAKTVIPEGALLTPEQKKSLEKEVASESLSSVIPSSEVTLEGEEIPFAKILPRKAPTIGEEKEWKEKFFELLDYLYEQDLYKKFWPTFVETEGEFKTKKHPKHEKFELLSEIGTEPKPILTSISLKEMFFSQTKGLSYRPSDEDITKAYQEWLKEYKQRFADGQKDWTAKMNIYDKDFGKGLEPGSPEAIAELKKIKEERLKLSPEEKEKEALKILATPEEFLLAPSARDYVLKMEEKVRLEKEKAGRTEEDLSKVTHLPDAIEPIVRTKALETLFAIYYKGGFTKAAEEGYDVVARTMVESIAKQAFLPLKRYTGTEGSPLYKAQQVSVAIDIVKEFLTILVELEREGLSPEAIPTEIKKVAESNQAIPTSKEAIECLKVLSGIKQDPLTVEGCLKIKIAALKSLEELKKVQNPEKIINYLVKLAAEETGILEPKQNDIPNLKEQVDKRIHEYEQAEAKKVEERKGPLWKQRNPLESTKEQSVEIKLENVLPSDWLNRNYDTFARFLLTQGWQDESVAQSYIMPTKKFGDLKFRVKSSRLEPSEGEFFIQVKDAVLDVIIPAISKEALSFKYGDIQNLEINIKAKPQEFFGDFATALSPKKVI